MRTSSLTVVFMLAGTLVLAAGCQDAGIARLNQGHMALDQGRADEALAAADEYLGQHPGGSGSASAMYLRGKAIQQRVKGSDAQATEDLRFAEQHYLKALELSPGRTLDGYLRTSLGNTAYWLGDYSAAAARWMQALSLIDNDELRVWVMYRVGMCRQRLGQWADADMMFDAVQLQAPGSEAAERAHARQGNRAFYVQVAAFEKPGSADKVVGTLRSKGFSAARYENRENHLQVVRVGPIQTYAQAMDVKGRLGGEYRDALIIP